MKTRGPCHETVAPSLASGIAELSCLPFPRRGTSVLASTGAEIILAYHIYLIPHSTHSSWNAQAPLVYDCLARVCSFVHYAPSISSRRQCSCTWCAQHRLLDHDRVLVICAGRRGHRLQRFGLDSCDRIKTPATSAFGRIRSGKLTGVHAPQSSAAKQGVGSTV